jgi:hypothetical protein
MTAQQREHLDRTPVVPRGRIVLRLGVALLAFVVVDLSVRARSGAFEATFFDTYRLPDIRTPPLDEFSDAVKQRRKTFPGRIAIGLAGPSNIWGHWLPRAESIPARLEVKLRAAGYPLDVYNLAMVQNRYSDDRAVAAYFAGAVDLVLVPYAQFQFTQQCPAHPEIIAWGGRIPEPFGEAPGCRPIARHRTNAFIDDLVRSGWATYRHRNAIRHMVFPDTGDFGRAMFTSLWKGFGINNPRPIENPGGVPTVPGDLEAIPPLAEVASEVTRLCQAYASRNTRVLFYRYPAEAGNTPEEEKLAARQIKGFEAFLASLHGSEPRCERLETAEWRPGPMMMFDKVHPAARGADGIANSLLGAVVDQLESPRKAASGAAP